MDLRDLLIIIGLIVLAIVAFDAIRRYRQKDDLVSLDDENQHDDIPDDESEKQAADWELPNGGARVIDSERVARPEGQESTFERRGLKTRLPFSKDAKGKNAGDKEEVPSIVPSITPSAHEEDTDDEPVSAAEELEHDDLDPKHTVAEAAHEEQEARSEEFPTEEEAAPVVDESVNESDHEEKSVPSHEEHEPAAETPTEPTFNTDEFEEKSSTPSETEAEAIEAEIEKEDGIESPVESESDTKEESESTSSEDAVSASEEPVQKEEGEEEEHPELSVEGEAQEEATSEEEKRRRPKYSNFDTGEEEVDDPRYEGLSEILLHRPLDGVARWQEAAAERRKKKAIKKEEARVRRHEERARRAEERAKRREEQERQAEIERQQRAERERLEQERRQQEAEERERRRREDEANARSRPRYEREPEEYAAPRARDDDRFEASYYDDEEDPLFASPRHDDRHRDSSVPYLGAVDTYDEAGYDSQESEGHRYADEPSYEDSRYRHEDDYARGERDRYQERSREPLRGASHQDDEAHDDRYSARSERDYDSHRETHWNRSQPERASHSFHPTIEKVLRNRVAGEEVLDVLSDADELVIINVVARSGESFNGIELTKILLACGLNYGEEGEMFHRFETEEEDSELQFSVINAMKPGRFPVLDLERFSTRGISFLLPMPSAEDLSGAFEAMLGTANVLVRHLNGELRDENQSVMTAQTTEFIRQRVREFERRMHLYRYSR